MWRRWAHRLIDLAARFVGRVLKAVEDETLLAIRSGVRVFLAGLVAAAVGGTALVGTAGVVAPPEGAANPLEGAVRRVERLWTQGIGDFAALLDRAEALADRGEALLGEAEQQAQ